MTTKVYIPTGTAGDTATTTNTGGSVVSVGSGNTAVIIAAPSYTNATLGVKSTVAGTNANAIVRYLLNAPNASGSFSVPLLSPTTTPPADATVATVVDTAGGTVGKIVYRLNGGIAFVDKSNTYTNIFTSGGFTTNHWYRFEIGINISANSVKVNVYDTANNASVGTPVNITSGANVGTTNINGIQVGISGSTAFNVSWDTVQTNDGSTADIGAYSPAPTPPTLNITSTTPITVVDLRTSTAGQGGALTYTATYSSGPILTYTQPVSGLFHFTPDSAADSSYSFSVTEANNSASPVSRYYTIAALTTTTTGGTSSITETVVQSGGVWG